MTGIATVHSDLRSAFRARLQAINGLPSGRAWEGRSYAPQIGTPFIRESFRPISSTVRAVGIGGLIAHKMTGNLNLFFPAGKGTADVEQAAGLILAAFAPGTSLVYGPSSGVILQAERSPILQEPDWISVPLTITVYAYTVT
ncbi:Protein of unknown function DUF4128 [uncultured Caudovirales phage]|uniref:Uncharacterized protein n=1 Tax=uncultured Caudovirales phage TaxID=2100421 RepID=A0A6J5KPJ0_9CAUD|nr:Protein of unknown function DUF4128 [uncultured Caudovirales phage]CAB4123801.1 Protein of unknown function DUF4128 [uncultured Caudovirales phage]